MTARIESEELSLAGEVAANDVCLLAGEGEAHLAWGEATLEAETVQLARWRDDRGIERLHAVPRAFRPRLAPGPVLACLQAEGDGLLPTLVFWEHGEGRVLRPPSDGEAHELALAPAPDGVWIAWSGPGGVELGRAGSGGYRRVALLEGRAPALVALAGVTWIAWISERGLELARVDGNTLAAPRLVAPGQPGDPPGAPYLASSRDGGWLACHTPVDEGTLRWLRLWRLGGDGAPRDCSPPLPREEREAAGEDQGWEFPAAVEDREGRLWLAGRSSGGFHLQVLDEAGWTGRVDLSGEGWSNRSRSVGLALLDGEVLFARGTPRGLRLDRLAVAGAGEAPAVPAAGAPAIVTPSRRAEPGWPPILFGDIHQHSVCSDGTGEPERAYERARQVYGHEIFALTDHEKLGRRCLGPVSWRYQCQLADAFYRPGELVTLRAYEFTGPRLPGPGHKCVYFDESVPEALPGKTGEALWRVLDAHGAIAVPHHVAWTGADLERHDPRRQPVWEICSVHGAYEAPGEARIPPRSDVLLEGQFLRQALDAGLVFGFVGGTDAHGLRWHHGVSRRLDPLRTGLTAVFAEPTREGVLAALRGRRCYATSGPRILLQTDLDGAPMGSIVPHHTGELHVEVVGTAPVERLSVIQDGQEVLAERGGARLSCAVSLKAGEKPSYCYVRVQQADGEAAWSSPIWLAGR